MLEQQLINALSLGSVYALFALGFTLIFGVLGVINLSHGAIFMLGSYSALLLVEKLALPLWLALLTAMLVAGYHRPGGRLSDAEAAARAQRAAPDSDDRHHRRRHHADQPGAGLVRRREQALPGRHDSRNKASAGAICT